MNCHLNVVEGFEYPSDPRSYVVWGYMPLVGSPKATGQTKSGSKPFNDELHFEHRDVARHGAAGAPPWSQAQGWGSFASTWWPGLSPWGPAGPSPKERRGAAFPWAHHLQEGP